ncbi:MAG: 3-isopropylmalate dehydratase small subunit [Burkholderiales bacterium]
MEAFTRIEGIAAPMLVINIDTDQIIPARFLGGTDAKGYGAALFANARFLADGALNPEFVLNRAPYDRAQVLLADRNFGCGSSRERAPKALREFGIRAILAPSFGGIFYNNCFRNGILPVELPIAEVRAIADEVEAAGGHASVAVDLETQRVRTPSGRAIAFEAPRTLREMLLAGIDEIGLTLAARDEIERWREADRARRPWAYTAPAG